MDSPNSFIPLGIGITVAPPEHGQNAKYFIANKDEYLNNITSVMLPALDYSKEIYERDAYLYVTDTEKAKKDFIKYMYQM